MRLRSWLSSAQRKQPIPRGVHLSHAWRYPPLGKLATINALAPKVRQSPVWTSIDILAQPSPDATAYRQHPACRSRRSILCCCGQHRYSSVTHNQSPPADRDGANLVHHASCSRVRDLEENEVSITQQVAMITIKVKLKRRLVTPHIGPSTRRAVS